MNNVIDFLRQKKISPIKLGIFTALALLFIIILISVIRKEDSIDDEFLAPVITVKPIYGSLEKTLRITGQVETGRLVTLAPRVGGILLSLNKESGRFIRLRECRVRITMKREWRLKSRGLNLN
ncbi:MAG: hypothetical protein FWB73_09670 [Treponema sp.]|nr:hypothetical protein [Treponema sp.]